MQVCPTEGLYRSNAGVSYRGTRSNAGVSYRGTRSNAGVSDAGVSYRGTEKAHIFILISASSGSRSSTGHKCVR